MPSLILVRHGQSQWNLENRFTGWWDVDLTEQGENEARAAGALLAEKGVLPPAPLPRSRRAQSVRFTLRCMPATACGSPR